MPTNDNQRDAAPSLKITLMTRRGTTTDNKRQRMNIYFSAMTKCSIINANVWGKNWQDLRQPDRNIQGLLTSLN